MTVLDQALNLQGKPLTPETPLLGSLPEFDSMAAVAVLTGLEEVFGFQIHDDEISASLFETPATLIHFVDSKLNG